MNNSRSGIAASSESDLKLQGFNFGKRPGSARPSTTFRREEHVLGEHPYIDTVVVSQGRVLHRRRSSYQDLLTSEGGNADEAELRTRAYLRASQHIG